MDDHNSISDSDGDGDGDSGSSISSSSNGSSNEDESNRITSHKRNKTKTKNSTSKKIKNEKIQPHLTTRKNRSNKNNYEDKSSKKKNKKKAASAEAQLQQQQQQSKSTNPSRRSKLAREHRITAAQEQEIHEVFHLFAQKTDSTSMTSITTTEIVSKTSRRSAKKIFRIHVKNLRPALTALCLTPTVDELKEYISILDPGEEGMVEYEPFLGICALKMNSRMVMNSREDHQREVDEAWGLFVREGDDRITLASLREVAKSIGEDGVSNELLRDMVLEANGGAGLAKGVEKGEFEDVMRKAGVWR